MIQSPNIRMVLKQFSLPSTKKKNALLPSYFHETNYIHSYTPIRYIDTQPMENCST